MQKFVGSLLLASMFTQVSYGMDATKTNYPLALVCKFKHAKIERKKMLAHLPDAAENNLATASTLGHIGTICHFKSLRLQQKSFYSSARLKQKDCTNNTSMKPCNAGLQPAKLHTPSSAHGIETTKIGKKSSSAIIPTKLPNPLIIKISTKHASVKNMLYALEHNRNIQKIIDKADSDDEIFCYAKRRTDKKFI